MLWIDFLVLGEDYCLRLCICFHLATTVMYIYFAEIILMRFCDDLDRIEITKNTDVYGLTDTRAIVFDRGKAKPKSLF